MVSKHFLSLQHILYIHLVADDWEFELAARYLIDVLHPAAMAFHRISGQSNQLDTATGEFRLEFGKGSKLSGAPMDFGQPIERSIEASSTNTGV